MLCGVLANVHLRVTTSRETVFNYIFQSSFRHNMNLSQNGWRELLRCSPPVPYNGGRTSQILKRGQPSCEIFLENISYVDINIDINLDVLI